MSVAVGVGGLGVLVGVGVTARLVEYGQQAIVSQTRSNKSRVARMILHQPRCVSQKEVKAKAKAHPPHLNQIESGVD